MSLSVARSARPGKSTDRSAAPASSSRGWLLVALAMLVVVAVIGTVSALSILRTPNAAPPGRLLADPASADLVIGQPVRTSYGSIVAADAEINNGLSSQDLGGMSHGVSSLVGTGKAQINVVVTITNTGRRAVEVAAGQFGLLTGRNGVPTGKPLPVQGTSMQASMLAPGASVDTRVTFVTVTDGSQLWLEYTDPGSGRTMRIALGSTSKITAPTHQH